MRCGLSCLLLGLFIVSCAGQNAVGPGETPLLSLSISQAVPKDKAIKVSLNTHIQATFSMPMEGSSLTTQTFKIDNGDISGEVKYETSSMTATFTPSQPFAANTQYAATVTTGVKSATGEVMASDHSWIFTTGDAADTTPPTIEIVFPSNGLTNVSQGTTVQAIFSEAIDVSTLSTGTFTVGSITGTVSYDSTTLTAMFTPQESLSAGISYSALISTAVQDMAGNKLSSNYTWSFTTVAADDGDGGNGTPAGYSVSLLYTKTGLDNSLFGWSVSNAGDVDGDNINDFMVGAPSTSTGTIYVYSGASGDLIYSKNGSDGDRLGYAVDSVGMSGIDRGSVIAADAAALNVSIFSKNATLISELSVSNSSIDAAENNYIAGIGDIGDENGAGLGNLDNIGDFIVGDYAANANDGTVTVHSGNDGSIIRTHTLPDNDVADRFGTSVAGLGDTNGDGVNDYIVGSTRSAGADGKIYVFSGTDGSTLYEKTSPLSPYDYGWEVSSAGDIDNDGRDDFMTNAIERRMEAPGLVYLYSGATGNQIGSALTGSVLFGRSLSPLGDVNGDNKADFIIGDPEINKAYVYSGGSLTAIAEISPSNATLFGFATDNLGDINGDGKNDFIIGAPLVDKVFVYISQ
jgi:hypothetical protein